MFTKKYDTLCLIYSTDDRYDELLACARDSFLNFHKNESDFCQIDYKNLEEYKNQLNYYTHSEDTPGLMKFIYGYEMMRKHNYKKLIMLGCDTITCSRLDEFMDDNTTPVLATLNYWIHEGTEYWKSPIIEIISEDGSKQIEHLNINADVVCFNDYRALERVIYLTLDHYGVYCEQGGLNELAWADKTYDVKIVDAPYPNSKVSYNVRAKGVPRTNMIKKGKLENCYPYNIHGFPPNWLISNGLIDGNLSPMHNWYIKDDKLFTHDNKQIKCFHYVEGIGGRPLNEFKDYVHDFKTNWFNEETKKFFKEKCNCKEFFI